MTVDQSDNNPYTRGLAEFVSGLRFEAIPAEVVARVKLLILDGFGCGIFGSLPEHSRILITTLAKFDQSTTCGVWGTRQRLSAPHAALANGSMVQAFELDDGHSLGSVHISCGSLPAIMAVAESRPGLSGKTFITAAVAACETAPRVGMCMGEGFSRQGWHSGALSVFSGVAAAAAALQLPAEKALHALGIAGTQAAGLMAAQYGSMVKRMHAGRGAQSGLYAAFLAEADYTGIVTLFESEYGGFCSTYSGSSDRFSREELTKGLGQEFETLRTSLKFYASAASTHTALDALLQMRARRPFKAEDVEKIIIHACHGVVTHVGWKFEPRGLTSAQMNLPYCMATLLLEGDVFIEQFNAAAVNDPRRVALAEKIEIREDPAITAKGRASRYEVVVQVRLKDGTLLQETAYAARGSAKQFATEDEVVAKFEKLASRVLPLPQVTELRDMVLNLDKQRDVIRLAQLLTLH
jgi:2-methylcitrate dehydratase PrpD